LGIAGGVAVAAGIGRGAIRPAHAEDEPETEVSAPVRIHAAKWAVVPVLGQAPVIDGTLDEAAWSAATELSDFRSTFTDEPVQNGPSYRIGVTSTHLFLGGTASLVDKDAIAHIEVLISTAAAGNDHFVVTIPVNVLRPLTTEWDRSIAPQEMPSRTNVALFDHAIADDVTSGTFGVEVSIPFTSLGGAQPEGEWRINIVHVHNVNTLPTTSWYPIRTANYMARYEGDNVPHSADLVNEGRLGSLLFDPPGAGRTLESGNWMLNWTGFTTKQVIWEPDPSGPLVIPRGNASTAELHLDWKHGERDWQRLTDVTGDLNNTELHADFTHPEPSTAASYQLRVSMTVGSSGEIPLGILSFDREDLVRAGEEALDFTPTWPSPTAVTVAPPSSEVLDLLDLVPERSGFRYVGLPEDPDLLPDGLQLYSLSTDALSLVSKTTSTVYPNAAYPETETMVAISRDGSQVTYPYHEDADGRTYFITGHLHHLQKAHVRGKLVELAGRDPLGAARVLHRFAQMYQLWSPTTDAAWTSRPMDFTSGHPFNHWGGMWGRWHPDDVTSTNGLYQAYGIIKETDAFEVLGDEVGADVEDLVLNQMLVPSFDFSWSFPITLGNQDGQAIRTWAAAGQAMMKPDYVHRAVEWLRAYCEQRFMADGFWFEVAVTYHRETLVLMAGAFNALAGYTDPDGFVSPRTGARFDNLDLSGAFPALVRAERASQLLVYPNGKTLPLQDSWASDTATSDLAAGTVLLPSAGIARMTWGEGGEQSQLYLNFTSRFGHHHADPLTITMFSGGQEVVPDIGYTYTNYRYSSISTIGHNTVVVDSADATGSGNARYGGSLERLRATEDSLLQVVRARQDNAYPSAQRYARELWTVAFDQTGDEGYVIDLFRVSGGSRHEYTLSGDANRDSSFETWLDLTPYGDRLLPPGVTAVEATSVSDTGSAEGHYPGYIYVKDVDQADLTGRSSYELIVSSTGDGPQTNLAVLASLEPGDNEVFLGRSPSLRTTRLQGRTGDFNDAENLGYTLPKLVHRRDGSDLTSTFVTALESFDAAGQSRLEAIDRLTLDAGPTDAVAVKACHGDVTDLVVSSPGDPSALVQVAGISMRGEWGLVRLVDGDISQIRLIGGTELTIGSVTVTGAGMVTGQVTATRRTAAGDSTDALVVDTSVPSDAAGCFVVVTQPDGTTKGFRIGSVTATGAGSELVLAEDDPGFTIHADGSSEQTCFPSKRWPASGEHTFSIALDDQWDGPATPLTTATGIITGTVTDPDGAPLSGVEVHVSGLPSITAVSGTNGSFTLTAVPVGSTRVTASKAGYMRGISTSVTLTNSATVTVEVRLPAETPPVLTEVTALLGVGDQLAAITSKNADLCLVPGGTPPREADIRAAATGSGVTVANAQADVVTLLSTSGLTPGDHLLFGIDAQGKVSLGAPVRLLATDLTAMEDSDPYCSYTGVWKSYSSTSYHGGTVRRAESVGATVDIPFHGAGAKVIGSKSANNGVFEVRLDGQLLGSVDTYAASNQFQQVLFDTGAITRGVHTLQLLATGEKSAAAQQAWVTFDAITISH